MTKKEQILDFLESHQPEKGTFYTKEEFLEDVEGENISIGERNHRCFGTTYDQIKDIIEVEFDDDLVGSISGVAVKILKWHLVPNEEN